MSNWYNETGRPLSSLSWLLAHHRAKIEERKKFVISLLETKPKQIIDLGCGPGLWLELFNEIADPQCSFCGIDSDPYAIEQATKRSKKWDRVCTFILSDIEKETERIPVSDLFLAFNIFSYVKNPNTFLEKIKGKLKNNGMIAVRQYDGGTLRFGPISSDARRIIDTSLQVALSDSLEFHHYDLDRVYQVIQTSSFKNKQIKFELFERVYPYSDIFLKYFKNNIEWVLKYISENAANELNRWYKEHLLNKNPKPSYFTEVDLVSILS